MHKRTSLLLAALGIACVLQGSALSGFLGQAAQKLDNTVFTKPVYALGGIDQQSIVARAKRDAGFVRKQMVGNRGLARDTLLTNEIKIMMVFWWLSMNEADQNAWLVYANALLREIPEYNDHTITRAPNGFPIDPKLQDLVHFHQFFK